MSRTRALILLATLSASALAEDVVSGLTRNAWYWQARARSDKAEDAWKQVLEAAPDNPEALAAVGGFHARAGRMQQAKDMLARLEKASPGHPDVPVLRRQIELGPRYVALLAQARKPVHEGQVAEGAAKYRELFGPAGPPGDLALEYYQTVGGTAGGFELARDGLRRLVRRAPGEARYKLALGRQLTYREETRREGIQMLSAASRDATVAKEAAASWRQALLWLVPTDHDAALFREWLRAHPGDAEVSRHFDRARNSGTLREAYAALDRGDLREAERLFDLVGTDPEAARGKALIAERRAGLAKKAGFAALDRGDLAAAEEAFREAGNDGDARLGHALVALKRAAQAQRAEDFARARDLLERARKLVPDRRDVWEGPLRSVAFWWKMRDARLARGEGREADAEADLHAALGNAPPGDRWHADLELANLLLETDRSAEAEAHLRDVLSSVSDQPDALRALAGLLVQEGRFEEATLVNDRLVRAAPHSAFRAGWLRAESLRNAAVARSKARDFLGARELLARARDSDPSDLWVLHDFANALLELNAVADAQQVVQDLLRIAPDLPETRITLARLRAAQHDDAGALAALRSVSPAPVDPAVLALQRRLELKLRIPEALALATSGRRDEAVAELSLLEQQARREPDLAAQVAVGWSRLGERGRALALMRDAVARAPAATRGARLELASALLDAGDDSALGEILRGLERDPSLSAGERRSLGELRVAHAVRLADKQRDRGDLAGAQDSLAPALRDYPDDPRLYAALARVREQAGDAGGANALYLRVLRASPGDAGALRGAVDTALARGDVRQAKALLEPALARAPGDPRLQQLSAHVAEREGDDGGAVQALRRASTLLRGPEVRRGTAALQEGVARSAPVEGAPRLASQAESETLRSQIARDLERIEARHRPAIGGEFEFRQRLGEAGLGFLTELRESAAVDMPVAFYGRLRLRISEVEVDAGNVAGAAASRFGSGGAAPGDRQSAFGTEVHATYESAHLVADIGTTPLGFAAFAGVGGVRVRGDLGPVFASVEASSRSVNESFVSMAGAADPATGQHWGAVLLQGGRLDLAVNGGQGSIYAFGEAGRLVGLRVRDNTRVAGGGGAELSLGVGPLGEFRMGPGFTVLSYANNQGFFTLGHGGYFSPQRFFHGAAVFRWRRSGKVRWEATAEPGYDWYQQAHAPVFPLNPDGSYYAGQTSGALSFTGRAFLGVGIGQNVELGLSGAVQRAPEFQEVRAALVLRAGGI